MAEPTSPSASLREAAHRVAFLRAVGPDLHASDPNLAQTADDAQAWIDAAKSLAKGVVELTNAAPAEWDGGDLGYLVGGVGSEALDLLSALGEGE